MGKLKSIGAFCALLLVSQAQAALKSTQIENHITNNNSKTVEEALAGFPKEMLSNFTLVYDSQSIQPATYQAPRVLTFDLQGTLVAAFNGDPTLRGYNTLEMLEFDLTTNQFHTKQILFGQPLQKGAQQLGQNAQVITNPKVCTACHGVNSHPLFDSYDKWPGFYGSKDDCMSDSFCASEKELSEFKKFKDNIAHSNLYKKLKFSKAPMSPYTLKDGDENIVNRPNLRLSKLLIRRNVAAMVQRIVNSASLQDIFGLSYTMLCEPQKLNSYVSEKVMSTSPEAELSFTPRCFNSTCNTQNIVLAKYFKVLGVTPGEFNLGFALKDPIYRGFFDGTVHHEQLIAARLLEYLSSKDKVIKKLAAPGIKGEMSRYSGYYKKVNERYLLNEDAAGKYFDPFKANMENLCERLLENFESGGR